MKRTEQDSGIWGARKAGWGGGQGCELRDGQKEPGDGKLC